MKRCVLLAGLAGAVFCSAEAVTYAKLSDGTFKFYTDEACSTANAGQTAVNSDTIVLFSSLVCRRVSGVDGGRRKG